MVFSSKVVLISVTVSVIVFVVVVVEVEVDIVVAVVRDGYSVLEKSKDTSSDENEGVIFLLFKVGCLIFVVKFLLVILFELLKSIKLFISFKALSMSGWVFDFNLLFDVEIKSKSIKLFISFKLLSIFGWVLDFSLLADIGRE